uniref:RING-type E3 ubiquitin transferase n=1 Tax=Cicer arietinum TaxID=3827 RepID=A0A1S2YZ54_CICAR|nr:E3 ubiquitin-protein ligase MBR2-like isoform X1 [Cicer arietinum]
MSQYRLANWQNNEDNSPSRESRALRLLLTTATANAALNNRSNDGGGTTTTTTTTNQSPFPPPADIISALVPPPHPSTSNSTSPRLFGSSLFHPPATSATPPSLIPLHREARAARVAPTSLIDPFNYGPQPSLNIPSRYNNNQNGGSSSSNNNNNKRTRSPDHHHTGEGSSNTQGSQHASGTTSSSRRRNLSAYNVNTASTWHFPAGNDGASVAHVARVTSQAGPSSRRTTSTAAAADNNNNYRHHHHHHHRHDAHVIPAFSPVAFFGSDSDSISPLDISRHQFPWSEYPSRRNDPSSSSPLYAATTGAEAYLRSTNLHRNNNDYVSSTVAGGSSFSFSSPFGMRGTSTGWGQSGNNNNVDFFEGVFDQPENNNDTDSGAYVHNTINVEQYVRVAPGGQVTLTSSLPAPSDPSPSNHVRQIRRPRLGMSLGPPPSRSTLAAAVAASASASGSRARRRDNNDHILTSTSPELRIERNRLRDEIFRALQHLRNGGSVRVEDLLMLDYSIVLNLLDSQERVDQINNSEDWPYEMVLALEEQMGRVETGLTEQEIMNYIEQEVFHSTELGTSTHNETCTICQEDYVDGERIGRLDCRHIYHLDCIKQWLAVKNVCPICKQTALEIDEDEDESD